MSFKFKLLLLTLLFIESCKNTDHTTSTLSFQTGKDYPAYGGNKEGNRYSPLTQINQDNVKNLEIAWTYFANNPQDTSNGKAPIAREIQCQPIVVNGILYGISAELNLFALNAASGIELWKFVPDQADLRPHANRGVMYWENSDDRRILYTAGSFLYAINAKDGKVIASFGNEGKVDLHEGLAEGVGHRVDDLRVVSTSPGVIFKNTLVIGSSLPETGDAAPGNIRAFDVITGKLKWVFHTIPQPGEFGYDTWPKDAYKKFGAANSWAGMALDEKRGLVIFGTGSPSSDYYGGDREGSNLFSDCIMALDAETGKYKWHFQAIAHDLWDRDFPCPPNLASITQNGKKIDVVVQAGKDGYVWVLDRDNGKSIFPIEERPVPVDGLPGEHPNPTQKTPSKPLPLMRQLFTEDDITNISPEAHEFVKNRFNQFPRTLNRNQPPSTKGTILFGYSGGAEWGGNAIDPDGILYVNSNEAPWELTMIDKETRDKEIANLSKGNALFISNCASCHGVDRKGNTAVVPSLIDIGKKRTSKEINALIRTGNGRMPAFPYLSDEDRNTIAAYLLNKEYRLPNNANAHPNTNIDTLKNKDSLPNKPVFPYEPGYMIKVWQRLTDQNGYNALTPPWGTLNAIDLNTGDYLWRVPLGEFPELTKKGIPITGTETYGGPVVTGSGLVFIASTRDERIRAFDKKTGKVVWEYQLPAGGFSTPITYEVDGKQYISIAAGGARGAKPGGWYMAFALK
jgi:quinoprotein glucose dehydrogenase